MARINLRSHLIKTGKEKLLHNARVNNIEKGDQNGHRKKHFEKRFCNRWTEHI